MLNEGIERLSAAIVAQAVKDCAADIKKGNSVIPHVRFFNSQYCYMLSGLEPNHLYELSLKVANERRGGEEHA